MARKPQRRQPGRKPSTASTSKVSNASKRSKASKVTRAKSGKFVAKSKTKVTPKVRRTAKAHKDVSQPAGTAGREMLALPPGPRPIPHLFDLETNYSWQRLTPNPDRAIRIGKPIRRLAGEPHVFFALAGSGPRARRRVASNRPDDAFPEDLAPEDASSVPADTRDDEPGEDLADAAEDTGSVVYIYVVDEKTGAAHQLHPVQVEILQAFAAELVRRDPDGRASETVDPTDAGTDAARIAVDAAAVWHETLGGFYSSEAVQKLLRLGTRQAVAQRKGLLRLRTTSGQVVYPAFQFQGRSAAPGIAEIKAELPEKLVSRWTLASWFVSPEPDLDNQRPIDVLRSGQVAAVVDVARDWAQALRQ